MGSRGLARYRKMQAVTPAWADKKAMRRLYRKAKRLGLEVDHIVPLNHSLVCGLHCEANLRLLTPEQNRVKANHNWPGSPFEAHELIPLETTEQYRLAL